MFEEKVRRYYYLSPLRLKSFVDHWNVGAKKSIPAMSSITDIRTHQMLGKQGKRKAENPLLNDAVSKKTKKAVSFSKNSRTSTGFLPQAKGVFFSSTDFVS